MKILYLLHTAEFHGSTISALNLIKNIKYAIEPIVLLPSKNSNKIKQVLNNENIRYYQCWTIPISVRPKNYKLMQKNLFIIKTFLYKIFYLLFLVFIVIKERPQLIHTNVGVLYEGFRVAKIFRIFHIWHLREYQDKDFNYNFLYGKKYFENMLKQSYVICISQDIRRHFNLNTQRAVTIYNGIYSKNHIAFETKNKYFLCASRITPTKGQNEVIEAFATFYKKNKDWNLIIAGEGEQKYVNQLIEKTIELGCLHGVKFIGFQNSNSIFNLMKKSAALIVASQNEGFGRMTAEACFAGTTIIGKYTGGTKEILDIIKGFPYIHIDDCVHKMELISKIINTIEYDNFIKKSQEKAQNLFSIENNTKQTLKFYHSIIR